MGVPRDSGRYNALTLRTRLTDLVEAKTNFITAYQAGTALVLITVPLTDKQYERATTGFAEASTASSIAAVLADMAIRDRPSSDGSQGPFDFGHDGHASVSGDDLERLLSGDDDVQFVEAEELPPNTARLMDHAEVDEDMDAHDEACDTTDEDDAPREISVGDDVYMLTDRKMMYKVVAVGEHVAALSYVVDGELRYTVAPFGTFAWVPDGV